MIVRALGLVVTILLTASGPTDDPAVGAHLPSQSAADVIREFAAADAAFLPAGLVRTTFQKDDLSTLLVYPKDTVVVLSLTGAQIKEALERSVGEYPQPNVGFLQLSGIEATFKKEGGPNSRVTSSTLNGSKLEDARAYDVAMPSSLQRGQLGYWNLWDKAKIVRSYHTTLAEALKGRHVTSSSPRWSPQD